MVKDVSEKKFKEEILKSKLLSMDENLFNLNS